MAEIILPFDIIVNIHPNGVSVRSRGVWVENENQARGLRLVLDTIGKAVEFGVDPHAAGVAVVPIIQALQENRIGMSV